MTRPQVRFGNNLHSCVSQNCSNWIPLTGSCNLVTFWKILIVQFICKRNLRFCDYLYLQHSILKLTSEVFPMRFCQRTSSTRRDFDIIPIEVGKPLHDAFFHGVIKARCFLLRSFGFWPIAISRIHPPLLMGKDHVEWDDLFPLTERNVACLACLCIFWQEHQNKLVFVVMDFGEDLPSLIITSYCCNAIISSFWPVRVLISGAFLSRSMLIYILLCKGSATPFVWLLFQEIEVTGENRSMSTAATAMECLQILSCRNLPQTHPAWLL